MVVVDTDIELAMQNISVNSVEIRLDSGEILLTYLVRLESEEVEDKYDRTFSFPISELPENQRTILENGIWMMIKKIPGVDPNQENPINL